MIPTDDAVIRNFADAKLDPSVRTPVDRRRQAACRSIKNEIDVKQLSGEGTVADIDRAGDRVPKT